MAMHKAITALRSVGRSFFGVLDGVASAVVGAAGVEGVVGVAFMAMFVMTCYVEPEKVGDVQRATPGAACSSSGGVAVSGSMAASVPTSCGLLAVCRAARAAAILVWPSSKMDQSKYASAT